MTPAETVARVVLEHEYRPSSHVPGVGTPRCACGLRMDLGRGRQYAAHVAAEVVAALGLRSEYDYVGFVRYVTDWQEVEE